MNPYLDDDLIALSDQARRFAGDRIAPGFQERDRTRILDRAIMKEMGAMGFIAPELPEKFGGLGLGCLAAGVIHEEVARADLSISYINLLASLNGQILSPDRGVMEQRLRDVLGFQIGDGTAQIMKTIIARARAGRAAVPA